MSKENALIFVIFVRMKKYFLFLFLIIGLTKISAQNYSQIAEKICHSLKVIKGKDTLSILRQQTKVQSSILKKEFEKIHEDSLAHSAIEKNFQNFINILNYKITRDLNQNCPVKLIVNNYNFLPLTQVVDFDKVFSLEEFKDLGDRLRKLRIDKSIDVLVLEVDNFYPFEDITDYSFHILENWNNGIEAKNGKLIIVFSKDLREIRISTDYISKEFIDDQFLQNIIDNQIPINFKAGDFYKGIAETLNEIEKKL